MQDMRFNQPAPPKQEIIEKTPKVNKISRAPKIAFLILVVILVFLSPFLIGKIRGGVGFWGAGEGMENPSSSIDSSEYYAVFLDNSQVYFGKIVSKSKEEIKLVGVYYLQANSDGNIGTNTDQKFTLIKLGQEVHGPTDELNINVDHVVFYEKLRKDSKLVETISNSSY